MSSAPKPQNDKLATFLLRIFIVGAVCYLFWPIVKVFLFTILMLFGLTLTLGSG